MSAINFTLTRNGVAPALIKMAVAAKDREKILRVMGNTLTEITKGNFTDAGAEYRPKDWPTKVNGAPSHLQKSGNLLASFQLEVTSSSVKISNPLIYASVHQFGATIRPKKAKALSWIDSAGNRVFAKKVTIPARPYVPIVGGELTPKAEARIRAAAERELKRQISE